MFLFLFKIILGKPGKILDNDEQDEAIEEEHDPYGMNSTFSHPLYLDQFFEYSLVVEALKKNLVRKVDKDTLNRHDARLHLFYQECANSRQTLAQQYLPSYFSFPIKLTLIV